MSTRKWIRENWKTGWNEAGDQGEEAHAMSAKMKAWCGCRVLVAVLFSLTVIISAVGCGTGFMQNYRASLQDPGGPRFKMYSGKIEHNLLNARIQKSEKEDWEED
jgi:hypothetical protein